MLSACLACMAQSGQHATCWSQSLRGCKRAVLIRICPAGSCPACSGQEVPNCSAKINHIALILQVHL